MKVYIFGPFVLDEAAGVVRANGKALALGDRVMETLLALLERPGHMLTIEELIARVWPEGYVDRASLAQNIYILRRTFREHWDVPVIETVRRRGYRITVPVRAKTNVQLTRSMPYNSAFTFIAFAFVILFLLVGLRGSSIVLTPIAPSLSQRDIRLYALGKLYWNMRGRDNAWKSVAYFREFVRSQPSSALGYAGLAYAYALLADYNYGPQAPAVYLQLLRANAARAMSLDPNLSDAHVALAKTYELNDRDFPAAESEFRRAIELDGRNAVAHHWYSVLLISEGNVARAREEIDAAQKLDPANPSINSWVAVHRYLSRDYASAIAYDRWSLAVQPDNLISLSALGIAYEQMRDFHNALRAYHVMRGLCKCATAELLEARTEALLGHRSQALSHLHDATASSVEHFDPLAMAAALIAIGHSRAALEYVREAAADPYLRVWLVRDPRFDSLRSDPRFAAATSS